MSSALPKCQLVWSDFFFCRVGGVYLHHGCGRVQRWLLICRRWTSPELPDTACPPHWGLEKKRTKDNHFQVERLSQWFTFRKSKEEKVLIIETSTRIFRGGESAGWPRHLALVKIFNKEALFGLRVLKRTVSIWLWGAHLMCHCLLWCNYEVDSFFKAHFNMKWCLPIFYTLLNYCSVSVPQRHLCSDAPFYFVLFAWHTCIDPPLILSWILSPVHPERIRPSGSIILPFCSSNLSLKAEKRLNIHLFFFFFLPYPQKCLKLISHTGYAWDSVKGDNFSGSSKHAYSPPKWECHQYLLVRKLHVTWENLLSKFEMSSGIKYHMTNTFPKKK